MSLLRYGLAKQPIKDGVGLHDNETLPILGRSVLLFAVGALILQLPLKWTTQVFCIAIVSFGLSKTLKGGKVKAGKRLSKKPVSSSEE